MGTLLLRLLAELAVAIVGGLLGYLIGGAVQWPLVGMAVGGSLGSATWCAFDAWRAGRLMHWLRAPHERLAPVGGGLWAELGYRVERVLRTKDQQLAVERERLASFLRGIEASPNGVMLLSADDQIDWCTRRAAADLGLDIERDLRQPITNLVRDPDFVSYLKLAEWNGPVVFAAPGGAGLLSVQVRPYGNGQKLVLSQDITAAQAIETTRRDFVANVSHEIRTPLTVLAGFVETMVNMPLSEPERERVLLVMAQQAHRMQVLVDDLLMLSQLEGSPRPAADRWLRVGDLIRQVVVEARGLSAGRHVLELTADDASEVAGSEAELHSAMANLMTNAIRYTPVSGRIDVAWRRLPDGGAEFSVRDSGIGIAKDHLPRLTERFYRVDGSRSRETGGTGLGLSIVKHVMQRHGGALQIESEPGNGSCFRLMLPPMRLRSRVSDAETEPETGVVSADRPT